MPIRITSLQNSRLKDVLKLAKASERATRRATVVEGSRECRRALAAGIIPLEAYICPPLLEPDTEALLPRLAALDAARRTWLAEVTPDVFAKIAVRGASGGLLLVIPYLTHTLTALQPPAPAFLAIIEGVEKPGNLGAILRSADAAGVHAVLVNAGATDIHNPNVVRASLGTFFTVPVLEAEPAATIAWLDAASVTIVAATPEADTLYTACDYTQPVALVLGSEADGLSTAWRAAAHHLVRIPMFGQADSLNLATAAALLFYEVVRQRLAAQIKDA